MARPKNVVPEPPRVPAASFAIPEGMRESELGLTSNRTCNPWALDRVLGYLGVHSVVITDSIASTHDGAFVEMVRDGDNLHLFDKL